MGIWDRGMPNHYGGVTVSFTLRTVLSDEPGCGGGGRRRQAHLSPRQPKEGASMVEQTPGESLAGGKKTPTRGVTNLLVHYFLSS